MVAREVDLEARVAGVVARREAAHHLLQARQGEPGGLLVAPDWDIWRRIEADLIRRVPL